MSNKYFPLLYREVKGILLYHGFTRPLLPTKHTESREGCFAGKIGRENPWLSYIFNFPKQSVDMKMREFFERKLRRAGPSFW